MARSPLSQRASLCRIVVAVVLHDVDELHRWVAQHPAAEDALDGRALHEALLQCHLFCGFPRTLAALDVLRADGLALQPLDEAPESDEAGRGAALFDRIYGDASERVRAHLGSLSPTLAGWIAEHAYGRTLSRPGLDAASREVLAVVALAATGHYRQLASHARGAVRCGATSEEVLGELEGVRDLIPPERYERAVEVASQFAAGGAS